jgi:multiple sugar transport system substrate-binding protein
MTESTRRRVLAASLAAAVLAVATACGTSGAPAAEGTYTVWDPYPQFGGGSAWEKLLKGCGSQAGVKVERTAFDTTDLTNKTLLAAQQRRSPDVLIVDNPVVSTLADAGVLTTTEQNGIDTSQVEPNLLAAGQAGGKTYGTPIGANTLALYYNKDVLRAAGVDPASVTDWASLDAALAAVKAAGRRGITFSAIGTEEGSFQFLPWYWGAGARLTDLSSAPAVSALTLWAGWLKKGYAPDSVINNTQTTSWQEFAAGGYAFAENGTWQLANAGSTGFGYGTVAVPARSGGTAPTPAGGEFVTVPVQRDTGRYATSDALVSCLTSAKNLLATDATLSYVAPTRALQDRQVAADPRMKVWVDAVRTAKGRTSGGLGTAYPVISEQLWGAVQTALTGSKSPQDALSAAQSAAE